MSFFYISNPYNGTADQKNDRAKIAASVCARLLKSGVYAWSPIVHNHAMPKEFEDLSIEQRRSLFLNFDFTLLLASKGMIVLKMDGWEESYGVKKEIELCGKKDIPIYYLFPEEVILESSVKKLLAQN
ncbi:DUF1937 family protein [bacterium]|nr:DUF1937 family protein [bacterium]